MDKQTKYTISGEELRMILIRHFGLDPAETGPVCVQEKNTPEDFTVTFLSNEKDDRCWERNEG